MYKDEIYHSLFKRNRKYYERVKTKDGKWRYFYTKEEYDRYMNGKNFGKKLKSTLQKAKTEISENVELLKTKGGMYKNTLQGSRRLVKAEKKMNEATNRKERQAALELETSAWEKFDEAVYQYDKYEKLKRKREKEKKRKEKEKKKKKKK